jgi:hypothetical protein
MPCNASYARFIFGKFFTSTIILYILLFAQKNLFLQKVGVTVVKDAISYARIQENNEYYKEVLHQKMNKKLGSLAIYLTEKQYC